MKRYELTHLEMKIETKAKSEEESELELSYNMAMEALAYVKTLRIKSAEDALLFMASANFVNKYIKIDPKFKKLYNFKKTYFTQQISWQQARFPKYSTDSTRMKE